MKIVIYTTGSAALIQKGLPPDLREQVELVHCRSREELSVHTDAEGLVATGKLDEELLGAFVKLRWIQVLSAGVDSLPLPVIQERQIKLTNVRGIHQIQISEFAMLLMLQWARRADLHFLNQMDKVWGKRVPSGELYGQTAGILGSGSIGQAIARKAKAFGMRTMGYNRSGRAETDFDVTASGSDGLLRILSESDYVITILPSTPDTRKLLGAEQFKAMKPSACFINLARGDVINEQELIEALRNGTIAGAALDVFEEEPLPPDSPLWGLQNVILTPHVAGQSPHYMTRAAEIVAENIRRFTAGLTDDLLNEVDAGEGY
ncbi:MAG: D-isomer specific 2-hydroxyacid dehydrogenase NAD-binding protein [Paenibacillaceae bacterium]|nr:D-isomer specific 2-hydroxyacid dehydrogenase NAD-binding protein [Paenibacillaceae bacterium]